MGQYYLLVNLTTGEYLAPHHVGAGAKLMEIAYSTEGLMTALTVLIASGNGRGGGDIQTEHPLVGSWAGHRVVLAGDNDDPGKFCKEFSEAVGVAHAEDEPPTLYDFALAEGKNISAEVRACFASASEDFGRQRRPQSPPSE